MFARQWFAPNLKEGLSKDAQNFHFELTNGNFEKAKYIANKKENSGYWIRQRSRLYNIMRLREESKHREDTKVIKIAFDGFWPGSIKKITSY